MKRATPAMVVLLLLVGCTHTTYDVELSTEDQQLRRVVTEKYRDTQNPEHNRDTLLTDSLCTVMPEDLDNAGQYVRYESQMGTAQLYIEQIRGNDHPAHIIETGLEKVEEGVDKLLTKMPELRAQMETWGEVDPAVLSELPKIETFIDTTLRDDLKDLYIYCYLAANSPYTTWQRSTDEDEPIDNHGRMTLEIGMRMGQFLLQEEYLTADTLPMWGRAFSEGMDFESGTGQLLLAAILERKAGVVNAPDVAAAFVEAMESSPATDEDTEADDNDTTADAYGDGFSAIFRETFGDVLFFTNPTDTLNATLRTSKEPVFTNGFWDEHEKTLHWNRPIPKDVGDATSVLPAICYAAWVDVNDEFQTERFGGTILADGDLYLYCLWKAGLTDDERSQWDDAISQCTPGSLAPLDDLNWDDQEHKEHGLEMIREAMGLEDDK